jgi:sulfite reductase (NADPH) hemoprotein beta-component
MYKYDDYDRRIVTERAMQFRGQVARRLSGEITEEEFKPLRLQNGLYMQLHAYMLRVAIPYGLLSATQVRKLAHIARTYDKGYGHLTTRQNIQYNWPKLASVPTILDELAEVEMHAVQTSGNCVRNITADHFAGIARDELEDPRPYCEILRQWSTFHPEFAHLPRKFKIAMTGAPGEDRAAVRFHDIGLRIVDNAQGERGFEVLVGGGLGRTPEIGRVIREFLPKRHLLSYIESILRVYNLFGRRDNKFKARIKILVTALGVDEFRRRVEEDWKRRARSSSSCPMKRSSA